MSVEETPANTNMSTGVTLDVSPALAPLDPVALADAATDISPPQADLIATEDAPPVLQNTHTNTIAEDPVAPAATEEFTRSDSAEIVTEVPTAVAKEEQAEVSATRLTSGSAKPSLALEIFVHVEQTTHVEQIALASETHNSETIVAEETFAESAAKEDSALTPAEPNAEHVTEVRREEASGALQEPATSTEPSSVAEVPTSTANDVEDVVPKDIHDAEPTVDAEASISSDAVEANGHLNHNPEPDNLNTAIDVSAPEADDANISESVAEPAEVHDMDHVEPTPVTAAPTTEAEFVDDVLSFDAVETNSHAQVEPEDPSPAVDVPVPNADDTTIGAPVAESAEPAEVYDTDYVEPIPVTAASTAGMESTDDATSSDAVEADGHANNNSTEIEHPSPAVDAPVPDADVGERVADSAELEQVHDMESIDDVLSFDTVEANGHALAELEDPSPAVDASTPNADDTTIGEPVAEPAEPEQVCDMDYLEPTAVTATPTAEMESVEDASASDVVEADSYADSNSTELEDPSPAVDASAPDADDTTIGEPVAEPEELEQVHNMDYVEPTVAPSTEIQSADHPDSVEHVSVTETITLQEDVPVSGGEVVKFSESGPTAEEVSPEMADEDEAAVHTHPEEAAALIMTDVDPVVDELLQSVEPTEEPVDVDHDASPADNIEVAEAVDPIVGEVSASAEPGEDVAPSAISEAQHASETVPVESRPVEEIKEVKHAEEATTHIEVRDMSEEPSTVAQELGAQEVHQATSAVPEDINLPASEQDDLAQEQPAAAVDSDPTPEEPKPFEVDTVPDVVEEEKTVETSAEGTLSDDQTAVGGAVEEEQLSEEAPAPAGEAVEEEVPAVADAIESSHEAWAVEAVTTAAEPTHAPEESVFVETVSVQEDTKDSVVAESEPLFSVDDSTPIQPSAEQTEPVEKAADEELLVREDAETPEVQEPINVEMPSVGVNSAPPADGPMEEASVHSEGETVVEESVVELPSTQFTEEESVEIDAAEEAVTEVALVEDTPEVSNEIIPAQDTDIETKVTEEAPSTLEQHVAEDTPIVEEVPLPVQNALSVHEDESQPAANDDIPFTSGEPLSEDQPTVEETLHVAVTLDEVPAPVDFSEELNGTSEPTVPVGQVETVEEGKNHRTKGCFRAADSTLLVLREHIPLSAVEDDSVTAAESQQLSVEQNELQEAVSSAQDATISPVTEEEMAISIPNMQESTYPDALVASNQDIDIDLGKRVDEAITSAEAVTQSESVVDSTVSLCNIARLPSYLYCQILPTG
jgi:hypothetical protein